MARRTTTTASTPKTTTRTTRARKTAAAASSTAATTTAETATTTAETAASTAQPETTVEAGAKTMPAPVTVKTLGKRELIDRVVEASGIKKKAAKPVIEAMLQELGDALSRGDTLNLQPFGKGIVKARKSFENADVLEVRLRRSRQSMAGPSTATSVTPETSGENTSATQSDPLAEAAE